MRRLVVLLVLVLVALPLSAAEPQVKERREAIAPPSFFGGGASGVFSGSATGSAVFAPTGRGVVFVPAPGRGNFAVGAGGYYLGGGNYYLPPTSYYHPYYGWSRPMEMYYSDPNYPYSSQATGAFAPLPYAPPQEIVSAPPPSPERASAEPKPSTVKQIAQAKRLIEFGDMHFQQKNLVEAVRRYKTATEIADDMPEAYYRLGIALVANGEYVRAGQAFQKGMALNPDWVRGGFRLDELYGAGSKEKEKDLDKLADVGLKAPNDPLPLFLLGVMLEFNGEGDRAAKFLEKANELGRKADLAPRPGGRRPQIGGGGF